MAVVKRDLTVTPVKSLSHIAITPNTKANQCVVCSKYVPNTRERFALYSRGNKTTACETLETGLGVCITNAHQNIVCRTCLNHTKSAVTKQITSTSQIQQLREQFSTTSEKTRDKYSVLKHKRSHDLTSRSPQVSKPRAMVSVLGQPAPTHTPTKSPPQKKLLTGGSSPSKIPVIVSHKKSTSMAKKKLDLGACSGEVGFKSFDTVHV